MLHYLPFIPNYFFLILIIVNIMVEKNRSQNRFISIAQIQHPILHGDLFLVNKNVDSSQKLPNCAWGSILN